MKHIQPMIRPRFDARSPLITYRMSAEIVSSQVAQCFAWSHQFMGFFVNLAKFFKTQVNEQVVLINSVGSQLPILFVNLGFSSVITKVRVNALAIFFQARFLGKTPSGVLALCDDRRRRCRRRRRRC